MKGLLIKDFCILNMQKRFFIIVVAMAVLLAFSGQSSEFIMGYLMMVFGIFAGSSISYDENNHGMGFIMTLPVNRKQYVRSKYVFMLLLILASLVLSLIFGIMGGIVKHQSIDFVETAGKGILMAAVMTAFISVFLALIIKYGAEKARVVILILFAALVLALYASGIIKDEEMFSIPLHIQKLSDGMLVIISCVSSAFFMLVSYGFSVRAMMKKEF